MKNRPTTSILSLPPLPSLVRYYDQFAQKDRVIRDISSCVWAVHHSGSIVNLDFRKAGTISDPVVMRVVLEYIQSDQISTGLKYYSSFNNIDFGDFVRFKRLCEDLSPSEFMGRWSLEILDKLPQRHIQSLRQILHWMAKWSIAHWQPSDRDLIRSLPGFSSSKYKSVSDGCAFISLADRSKIVGYIDKYSALMTNDTEIFDPNFLRDLCLLAIAFQLGLRPLQMAMLTLNDVRIFDENTVHISVTLIKQRHEKTGRIVRRKIQASWCPIFLKYQSVRNYTSDKFLGLNPQACSRKLSALTRSITGVEAELICTCWGYGEIRTHDYTHEATRPPIR